MKREEKKRAEIQMESGFTLIEALVVVLLTVIILIGLYDLMETNQKIYNVQQDITTMNLRTRTAVLQMVTAIRTAGSNNLFAANLTGNPFIAIAEANRIRVVEDLPRDINGDGDTFDLLDFSSPANGSADDNENENGDGFVNDPLEDVTFSLNGTDLIRTQYFDNSYCPSGCPATSDNILVNDIENLTFEYFSSTDSVIPSPVTGNELFNIKLVRVTVNAKTNSLDRLTGQPHRLELKSDIFLRN